MRSFAGIAGSPAVEPERIREVKDWARQAFGLEPDDAILVAQVACHEPGCPPIETMIAVLTEDGRTDHRLHMPIAEIAPMHLWRLAAGDHICCRP